MLAFEEKKFSDYLLPNYALSWIQKEALCKLWAPDQKRHISYILTFFFLK